MVSHDRTYKVCRVATSLLNILPLYLDFLLNTQYQVIVKVHGVFPSSHKYSASSRKIQFHWVNTGDSEGVVTPFIQVGTYPTRDCATLGPSGLRPPLTAGWNSCLHNHF